MARPRKNNADYFSHDSGMRNNRKVKVLRAKYGSDGYSAFSMTLELLTDADNFQVLIDEVELEIIAADFGFTSEKLQEIWDEAVRLRLLQYENNVLSCKKLIDRLEPLLKERQRQREKSLKKWNEVDNDKQSNNYTEVKPRNNPGETIQSKEKKSKLNKSKELKPENFQLFREVISFFDQKHFDENKNKWLDCYDKLIRIDSYPEKSILEIVKYFRSDDFWRGNLNSLLKLRKRNPENIKYIDVFSSKLKSHKNSNNGKYKSGEDREPSSKNQLANDKV